MEELLEKLEAIWKLLQDESLEPDNVKNDQDVALANISEAVEDAQKLCQKKILEKRGQC